MAENLGMRKDVLMFVDNIYRYTLAGTEYQRGMPSAVGYQPALQRWVYKKGITHKNRFYYLCKAVYIQRMILLIPSPATTFAHLDSTVVLSRDIASKEFILLLILLIQLPDSLIL